jgi:hypothetical protein
MSGCDQNLNINRIRKIYFKKRNIVTKSPNYQDVIKTMLQYFKKTI